MSCEKKYEYDRKVVAVGGGTGLHTLLRGLVKCNNPERITAVVGTWDSGGISGEQRVAEGILPPGDYIRSVLGLMEDEDQLREAIIILTDRSGSYPLTHLLAAKSEKAHHGVEGGIDGLRRLFKVRGRVLPVSLIDTDLHSATRNGVHFDRERHLDELEKDPDFCLADEVVRIFLVPQPPANPNVLEKIKDADDIVFAMGSPYGSVFPHLLVDQLPEAILQARGRLSVILNLMTTNGQDHHLAKASRWIRVFQYYLHDNEWIERTGRSRINRLIVNVKPFDAEVEAIYYNKGQNKVGLDEEECMMITPGMEIVPGRLAEYLRQAHLLRHQPLELAKTVLS